MFAAAYFLGNVPILSNLLGTNKAVDLGVTITTDAAYQGLKDMKMPVTIQDLQSIAKNPQSFKTVKASLTGEDVSSLLALGDLPGFPFKLTQVRFNNDGTIESSGVLDIAKLKNYMAQNGVSADVIEQVDKYVKVSGLVNYYIKGTCQITNNQVKMDVSSVQIGKIPLPDDLVSKSADLGGAVSGTLVKEGFNVRSMSVRNGKLELDADRPLSSLHPWLKLVTSNSSQAGR